MDQQFAVSVLYKWFKENIKTFVSAGAQTEFRDSGKGRAYVRVDSAKFMTEVSVWDEGSRLVVEIIDMNTDESAFPYSDDCETQAAFEEQLDVQLKWFIETHNAAS